MSRSKGGNRRIHTLADNAVKLPPSTLAGGSLDVPRGPFDGVVTQIVGAADLADKVRRARLRLAGG